MKITVVFLIISILVLMALAASATHYWHPLLRRRRRALLRRYGSVQVSDESGPSAEEGTQPGSLTRPKASA